MAKTVVVVEAVDERKAVRGIYKSARCRRIKSRKGFFVFYINENVQTKIIGQDDNTRAGAWKAAFANLIGNKVITKLES